MPAMPTRSAHDAAPPAAPAPLQVTISEAARLLAYNPRTIRRLVVRGELAIVGQGRLRRISMQSIHAYQERYLQAGGVRAVGTGGQGDKGTRGQGSA